MRKTDFINNIVLDSIKSDLIRMKDSVRSDPSKKGNNNFSLAVCVISYMEYLGGIGSSRRVTLYSDGDGDFRPKFEWDRNLSADAETIEDCGDHRLYDTG